MKKQFKKKGFVHQNIFYIIVYLYLNFHEVWIKNNGFKGVFVEFLVIFEKTIEHFEECPPKSTIKRHLWL